MSTPPRLFADLQLARRLEVAEGEASASFVDARAQLFPDEGLEWRALGSVRAMFDGPTSPLTQSFGFGLDEEDAADRLSEIESFFGDRGATSFHEVSPMAHEGALAELVSRGYEPIEYSSVMFMDLECGSAIAEVRDQTLTVRPIRDDEGQVWADVTVRGWSHYPDFEEYLRSLAPIAARRRDATALLVFDGDRPIAAGSMSMSGGVLLLAGACTVPEDRRRGAQNALLRYRLRHAREQGCDVAMMCAQPGSASQRNAERQGFRIAYTRIKWQSPEAGM